MSALELAAALLGLANIVLLVRRSVWNYPVALAMVGMYGRLFYRERLYSDALLQLFFAAVNIWGWWLWRRAAGRDGDIRVRTLAPALRWRWAAAGIAATLGWGTLMASRTDASYPWADATIAITSVVAQILLAKRYIENWLLWVAVDLASLPLYAVKALYPTVLLYALFLLLSIAGWHAWRRAERVA